MRTNLLKMLTGACLLSVQLSSFSAFAKGGSMVGGGGDTLINKDSGAVISIADPMALLTAQGKRTQIPQVVRDELEKTKKVAEAYFFSTSTFDSLTSESNVDYRLIDEIPNTEICQERIKYTNTDSNLEISQAACTSGNKTWLKKSIYEELLKNPSKRELALLLVHEGLRRVPNITNEDLVSITNGLRVALAEYDKQSSGEMVKLEDNQKSAIVSMLESVLLNGLQEGSNMNSNKHNLDTFEVSDYGGLIAKNAKVDESAIIGAGSIVREYAHIASNVEMIGSLYDGGIKLKKCTGYTYDTCIIPLEIPENVKLINSRINLYSPQSLSKNTLIENSSVKIYEKLGENAQIKNSKVEVFNIGSNAKILNSTVGTISEAGDNLKIISSNLNTFNGGLRVGSNFLVENSTVKFATKGSGYIREIPNNVSMKNIKNANFISSGNENDLLAAVSLGRLSNGKMAFPEGFSLDFGGKLVCNNNEYEDVFLTGESHKKIKSQNDLLKYCSNGKED